MDLSSEKNSLEEEQISTSLNDKPIFGSAGSQFDHSNIKNYLLRPGRALVKSLWSKPRDSQTNEQQEEVDPYIS